MMRNLGLLILILFLATNGRAQDSSSLANFNDSLIFKMANEAYVADKYDESLSLYNEILSRELESAEVYFNMGNAYFKKGSLPDAILYFEKAKKLNPQDDDISANLQIANLKTIDKVESKPELPFSTWWSEILNSNQIDEWAEQSLYLIYIALGFMLLYLVTKKSFKRISFFTGLFFALLSLIFYAMGQEQKSLRENSRNAIIFSSSVTVKSAPEDDGTRLFVIHEGTKIEILDVSGDWTEISLMNGNKGWVKSDSFKPI